MTLAVLVAIAAYFQAAGATQLIGSAIGAAIARGTQQDPYWKPFFEGYPPSAHPMAILSAMVGSLSTYYPAKGGVEDVDLNIVRLLAKAKTIAGYLGGGYVVESSFGHIRDLPQKAAEIPAALKKEPWARLGVNVEADFEPLEIDWDAVLAFQVAVSAVVGVIVTVLWGATGAELAEGKGHAKEVPGGYKKIGKHLAATVTFYAFKFVEHGKDAIARAMRKQNLPIQRLLTGDSLTTLAHEMRYPDISSLYAAIGEGHVSAQSVVHKLVQALGGEEAATEDIAESAPPLRSRRKRRSSTEPGVIVKGVADVWVKLARCCTPVPGDPIIGFVTRGNGVSVHRADCVNVDSLSQQPERIIDVEWAPTATP